MTTDPIKTTLTIVGALLILMLVACAPAEPGVEPGAAPTEVPTDIPTEVPTDIPTEVPAEEPTETPTEEPASPTPVEEQPAADLSGTTWTLVHWIVGGDAAVSPPAGAGVFFEIEDGRIAGNSGCNRFSGPVTIEGNALSVGMLISTKMACAEELMTVETTILEIMNNTATFSVTDNILELQNADGLPLAEFTAGEQQTLFVGPEMVACEGEGPQQCMLVRENLMADPELFYDNIEGFEWEAGYNYELRVSVSQVDNVPAGASSLQYQLLEVVSKTPVKSAPVESNLTGTTWQWQRFESSDGSVLQVDNPASYTLEFMEDGTYLIQADCNGGSGSYTAEGSSITLEPGPMTLAACGEQSLDGQFLSQLGDVVTYVFDEDGNLVLNLMMDAGNMVFAPAAD